MKKSTYSLGLYVHECPRMRYKAQFKGSQLLCNVTWKYFDIDAVRKQLDDHKNGLETDEAVAEEARSERVEASIMCLMQSPVFVKYKDFESMRGYDLFMLSKTDEDANEAFERMMLYVGTLPTELKYIFCV